MCDGGGHWGYWGRWATYISVPPVICAASICLGGLFAVFADHCGGKSRSPGISAGPGISLSCPKRLYIIIVGPEGQHELEDLVPV